MTFVRDEVAEKPVLGDFARAVTEGLSGTNKAIPCRFLYDARGSVLFEEITRLDEYYPTRTETGLLAAHGPDIAALAGQGCAVIEFGSGSSRKTHILLEHMENASGYVPIDIDNAALDEAVLRLRKQFPGLPLFPIHADFDQTIDFPDALEQVSKLGFFPGSTIGNSEHNSAIGFLVRARELLGEESSLLIGADLRKDPDVLQRAYDDSQGVTARFTLNIIQRINRELRGNLDITQFRHMALYNEDLGRIEIYLESLTDQTMEILGREFSLKKGERIHVENSHKYTLQQFRDMAHEAGWQTVQVWTDDKDYFSLHYLSSAPA